MESAERELLSLLGSVSSVVAFAVAIAVLVLGIVVVRPLNKVAGLLFAAAGGGRFIGLGLDKILDVAEPKDAGMDIMLIFNAASTFVWIVTAFIFYGGVMFASIKLAETQQQRGAS